MKQLPLVVLASKNQGKALEFQRLLGRALKVECVPAALTLPEETGETFAANARLKAQAVFAALGGRVAVLADDSGLEVAALGGRPGVQSARFAGRGASDRENVEKLLRELGEESDRRARFVCSLCMVLPGGTLKGDGIPTRRAEDGVGDGETTPSSAVTSEVTEGGAAECSPPRGWTPTVIEVEAYSDGHITHTPRGTSGFGYDPVFKPLGWTKTLAEAKPEEKDQVSHRGGAARSLLSQLSALGWADHGT